MWRIGRTPVALGSRDLVVEMVRSLVWLLLCLIYCCICGSCGGTVSAKVSCKADAKECKCVQIIFILLLDGLKIEYRVS